MILECIIIAVLGLSIGFLWRYSNPLNWLIRSRPLSCSKDRRRHDCILCSQAKKCLRHLHKQAHQLHKQPELSEEILQRLQYLLPAGVIFKEQRGRLHNLANCIHMNFMHSFKQNQRHPEDSKLHRSINILLTKLNRAATEQETRISSLHRLAESYTAVQHFTRLRHCIKAAVRLQHSNNKLLKNIHRAERYLSGILRKTTGRIGLILLLIGDNKTEKFI